MYRRKRTLAWRIKELWWQSYPRDWYYRARFAVTGDCGHYCEYQWLRDIETGKLYLQFIPEADCPVHDV